LTTTSGAAAAVSVLTALASVMSSSSWVRATTSCEADSAAATKSRPSMPPAPVTRIFKIETSRNRDVGVVADQEFQRFRHSVAAREPDVTTQKAAFHPRLEVVDLGPGEHDRVLD